jgi:NADH:ubiquinone oxidoreductase subunit K
MMGVPLTHHLLLAAVLFAIGAFGVITRRNAVAVLMSIELMLNAVNLNFLAFWRYVAPDRMEGQVFVLIVITVAAAEAAVGLAIILRLYRNFRTILVDKINLLKW